MHSGSGIGIEGLFLVAGFRSKDCSHIRQDYD